MPFTYSITNGIGAGFLAYVILMAATGRRREVPVLLWVIGVLFAAYFFLDPLQRALT
jgi:AGZA family xanthine/uracil permease-like MFS transporter